MADANRYRNDEEMREHFEQIVRERGLEQCVADVDAANRVFRDSIEQYEDKLEAELQRHHERWVEAFEVLDRDKEESQSPFWPLGYL